MFDDRVKGVVLLYINNLSIIKTEITGRDITELGLSPGPKIKKILEIVLKEKINGKIFKRSEEINYVKTILLDEEKTDG
jgi:tRNA nucleotidyltransferase (CCA-adding enzyme)